MYSVSDNSLQESLEVSASVLWIKFLTDELNEADLEFGKLPQSPYNYTGQVLLDIDDTLLRVNAEGGYAFNKELAKILQKLQEKGFACEGLTKVDRPRDLNAPLRLPLSEWLATNYAVNLHTIMTPQDLLSAEALTIVDNAILGDYYNNTIYPFEKRLLLIKKSGVTNDEFKKAKENFLNKSEINGGQALYDFLLSKGNEINISTSIKSFFDINPALKEEFELYLFNNKEKYQWFGAAVFYRFTQYDNIDSLKRALDASYADQEKIPEMLQDFFSLEAKSAFLDSLYDRRIYEKNQKNDAQIYHQSKARVYENKYLHDNKKTIKPLERLAFFIDDSERELKEVAAIHKRNNFNHLLVVLKPPYCRDFSDINDISSEGLENNRFMDSIEFQNQVNSALLINELKNDRQFQDLFPAEFLEIFSKSEGLVLYANELKEMQEKIAQLFLKKADGATSDYEVKLKWLILATMISFNKESASHLTARMLLINHYKDKASSDPDNSHTNLEHDILSNLVSNFKIKTLSDAEESNKIMKMVDSENAWKEEIEIHKAAWQNYYSASENNDQSEAMKKKVADAKGELLTSNIDIKKKEHEFINDCKALGITPFTPDAIKEEAKKNAVSQKLERALEEMDQSAIIELTKLMDSLGAGINFLDKKLKKLDGITSKEAKFDLLQNALRSNDSTSRTLVGIYSEIKEKVASKAVTVQDCGKYCNLIEEVISEKLDRANSEIKASQSLLQKLKEIIFDGFRKVTSTGICAENTNFSTVGTINEFKDFSCIFLKHAKRSIALSQQKFVESASSLKPDQ